MTSHQVKDQVRDSFEHGFDKLHRIADVVTFPLAPVDGAIHGISRGVLNWLTDNHPTPPPSSNGSNCYSPPPSPPHSNNPKKGPGGPPGYPPPPYNNYSSGHQNPKVGKQKIQNVKHGSENNKNHNNGAIKVANLGGA